MSYRFTVINAYWAFMKESGVLKIEESESEVLKIEESGSEFLCTDCTALHAYTEPCIAVAALFLVLH
jgi:hypothetical protein